MPVTRVAPRTRRLFLALQGSEDGGSGDTVPVRQNGGGTVPTCQVEKCRKELTGLTTYHQRCRICEVSRPGPSAMAHLAHNQHAKSR